MQFIYLHKKANKTQITRDHPGLQQQSYHVMPSHLSNLWNQSRTESINALSATAERLRENN